MGQRDATYTLSGMIELDEGYFKIAEQRIMETEPPIF